MTGYITKLETMGTLDGPGVRAVVFSSSCPLRCVYCHNPDTWERGEETSALELFRRIMRVYPYIKRGGVTFSGGEPCVQAEFYLELARLLKAEGLHIALDTSGCVMNAAVKELLGLCDLVLLDVKFTSDDDCKRYTGGTLSATLDFLSYLDRENIPTWIRHVIVPGINDTKEDVIALRDIISPYACIEKTELLPFRKLCLEKYEALGIPFLLRDVPEADEGAVRELSAILNLTQSEDGDF